MEKKFILKSDKKISTYPDERIVIYGLDEVPQSDDYRVHVTELNEKIGILLKHLSDRPAKNLMLEVRDNVRTLQNKIESSERRLIYVHRNTEEINLSVKQTQNVFQILERLTNNLELLSQYLNNYSESVESMRNVSISAVSVVEKKLENMVDSLELLKSEINRKLELVERIEKKIPNVSRLDYYEESVKDVNSTMMYLKDVLNRIPKKQEFNELKNGLNTLKEKIDEIEKFIKKPKIVSKVKKLKVRKQPRKKMKSKRKVKKITPKMHKCPYCSFKTKNPGALGMHKKVHKTKKKRKVIVKKILTDKRLDNLILETLSKGRLRFPEISMSTKVGKRRLTNRLDKLIADGKILKVYQNGLVYYMLV